MRLLGVDVGGTFTDIVFADSESGRIEVHKVPTTPADPSEGVHHSIHELCQRFAIAPEEIDHLFHGTTIATNAVLQYDGVNTGMITSENYRDILHIGRHQRPQHYSIMQEIPWQDRPLVRRRHRKTVPERLVPPNGEILVALDEDAVRRVAEELKQAGVDAIAICFLFSYLNSQHEERAREIVEEVFPDCFVTTSATVSPQFREFERFTTTAMNAFIGPKVRDYVQRLEHRIRDGGIGAELHIMGSNGGVATAKMVCERPVMTLLSGPAAGVLGGAWSGALSGRGNLITFDMGGTSADIGIVDEGRFAEASARDTWIAGYPLLVPMIDIHTIGAGGGSIAYRDSGGAFRVGPKSAGAEPGPATYGRGGTAPTVTDANVVLGRLDGEYFLGGEMSLDAEAAWRAIGELGAAFDIDERNTAAGVLTIVTANMANAIRSRTVQKGLDPRDFSLVAFGGAGPLHAADVARELGIREVIVPPYPGITSAMGLLTTDLKYDAIRTAFQVTGALDLVRLNQDFEEMEQQLGQRFAADGLAAEQISFQRAGDLRYLGQGYELQVMFPAGIVDDDVLAAVFDAFHDQHKTEYGHDFPQSPIEIVNLKLTGIGAMPKMNEPTPSTSESFEEAYLKTGECHFRTNGRLDGHAVPFYRRGLLPLGQSLDGPAIIVQKDSTTVVPPGSNFLAEAGGNMVIRMGDT